MVEVGVGTLDSAFLKELFSFSFNVSQVGTDTDEKAVVEVGTSGKRPSFGTAYEIAFLTLPDVALGYWTAIIGTICVLIKVDEIGLPSWVNIVREHIL